ncbi:MAG: hypothetical protein HY553_09490 [Elusimicrobia bacterium]|nr:hypothetical protein [Elusimicrobiota bacterium]
MDAGKPPGDDPLPFLIPLGPEDDGAAASSGLYTPAPVRNADPAKPPREDETRPPVVPPSRPRAGAAEPLVILDPLGQPATQPPPFLAQKQAPAPQPGGFEASFLGAPPVEEKPFEPPPAEPAAAPASASFEAPKLDKPVNTAPGVAIPNLDLQKSGGAFQPPSSGPAPGTFQFGGPPPPTPFAAPGFGAPPEPKLPLTAPPVGPILKPPPDRNAALRPPHTAPPIRLPGDAVPPAKPLLGMPSRANAGLPPAPPVPLPASAAPPAAFAAGGREIPFAVAPSAVPDTRIGFVSFMELAGLLPFTTQKVLARFREQGPPPTWLLLAHALLWVFAMFVIHAGLGLGKTSSIVGQILASKLAGAAAIGLGLAAVLTFASAGLIHVVARLSGGNGEFKRGLLIASLIAPMLAVWAALSPVETLWWLPWLLTTYLMGRCIAGLYAAPVLQVGIVVGALALFGGIAQYAARRALGALQQAADTVAPLTAAAAAVGSTPGLPSAGPGGVMTAEQAAVLEQLQQAAGEAAQGDPSTLPSGLDMLGQDGTGSPGGRPGGAQSAAGAPVGQAPQPGAMAPLLLQGLSALGNQPPTPEQRQRLGAASQEAVRRAQQVLDDPKMLEGLTPQQRAQLQQARGSIQSLMRAAQTGQKPSAADTQQLMQSVQQMMQEASQQMQQAQEQPPQPQSRRRRRSQTRRQ